MTFRRERSAAGCHRLKRRVILRDHEKIAMTRFEQLFTRPQISMPGGVNSPVRWCRAHACAHARIQRHYRLSAGGERNAP